MSVSDFHYAIKNGKVESVREMVECHPEWMDEFLDGYAGVHVAAQYGRTEIVALLLQAGSQMLDVPTKVASVRNENMHAPDPSVYAPRAIDLAAINNHVETAAFLIDRGCTYVHDFTPLHIAACCGNLEMVEFLIHWVGAMTPDIHGFTPLYYAYVMGNSNVIEALLAWTDLSRVSSTMLEKLPVMNTNFHIARFDAVYEQKPRFMVGHGQSYGREVKAKLTFSGRWNITRTIDARWSARNALVVLAMGDAGTMDPEVALEIRYRIYFAVSLTARLLMG